MNYSDIADVMGLTTKAVKSLLSRARAKLREELQGYIYMDAEPPPVPETDDN
jgi:RNA polymerase sigma-70 factor (ECF subfamily)